MVNSHENKAEIYDRGRVQYPKEFFDTIYNQLYLNSESIIADIGCGTGKILSNFLERGNIIYAVEPDYDMLHISDMRAAENIRYNSLNNTAENTGIPSNIVDMIFCGNSYHWFDRTKVIPEFKRILKNDGYVVLSNLGPGECTYGAELWNICTKYSKVVQERVKDTSPAFCIEKCTEGHMNFVVYQSIDEFLSGCFSASYMPGPEDKNYRACFDEINKLFNKYCRNDRLETIMRIDYIFGKGSDLI